MTIEIVEYIRENGDSPYKKWFDGLSSEAAAKVVTALLRIEMGNTSNIKWFHGIGEYCINWGPGLRIYLAKEGNALVILLGGGTKARQQTDIKHAKKMLNEYKARKRNNN